MDTVKNNTRFVIVLAIALFLVGAVILAYGVTEYRAQSQVLDDVDEVDATITAVELETYDDDGTSTTVDQQRTQGEFGDGVTFHLTVTFEYEYDGDQYQSSKFDAIGSVPTYDDWEDARDARDEYAEGDRITAYVPPDDPGNAFLDGGMPMGVYAIMGFGGFLMLGGLWIPIAHRFGIGTD